MDKTKSMSQDELRMFEVLGIDVAKGVKGAKIEWAMNGYDFMESLFDEPLRLDAANETSPTTKDYGRDGSPEDSSKSQLHSIHDHLKLCSSDLKNLLERCHPHVANSKQLMELDQLLVSSVNIAEKLCLENADLIVNEDQSEFAIPSDLVPNDTKGDDWIRVFQQSWCDWSSKQCKRQSSAKGLMSILNFNDSGKSNTATLCNASGTLCPPTADLISCAPNSSVESDNSLRIDPWTHSLSVFTPELETISGACCSTPASCGSSNNYELTFPIEGQSDSCVAPSHLTSPQSSNPRSKTDPALRRLEPSQRLSSDMRNNSADMGIDDSESNNPSEAENESNKIIGKEHDTDVFSQEEKEKMARMMEEARENATAARERKKIKKKIKVNRWIQEQESMKKSRAESWSGRISKEKDVMELLQRMVVTELVRQNGHSVFGLNETRVFCDKNATKEITLECRNAMKALFADLGESRIVVRGCSEKELNGRSGEIRHWESNKKLFFVCLDTKKSTNGEMRYLSPENLERADGPREVGLSSHLYKINLPSVLTYGGVDIGVCFSLRHSEVIALGSSVFLKAGLDEFRMQREKEDRVSPKTTKGHSGTAERGELDRVVPQIQESKPNRNKRKKRKTRRIVIQEPRGLFQAEIARKEIKKFIEEALRV